MMLYLYWFVGLILAISVGVIMAAHYELKQERENRRPKL